MGLVRGILKAGQRIGGRRTWPAALLCCAVLVAIVVADPWPVRAKGAGEAGGAVTTADIETALGQMTGLARFFEAFAARDISGLARERWHQLGDNYQGTAKILRRLLDRGQIFIGDLPQGRSSAVMDDHRVILDRHLGGLWLPGAPQVGGAGPGARIRDELLPALMEALARRLTPAEWPWLADHLKSIGGLDDVAELAAVRPLLARYFHAKDAYLWLAMQRVAEGDPAARQALAGRQARTFTGVRALRVDMAASFGAGPADRLQRDWSGYVGLVDGFAVTRGWLLMDPALRLAQMGTTAQRQADAVDHAAAEVVASAPRSAIAAAMAREGRVPVGARPASEAPAEGVNLGAVVSEAQKDGAERLAAQLPLAALTMRAEGLGAPTNPAVDRAFAAKIKEALAQPDPRAVAAQRKAELDAADQQLSALKAQVAELDATLQDRTEESARLKAALAAARERAAAAEQQAAGEGQRADTAEQHASDAHQRAAEAQDLAAAQKARAEAAEQQAAEVQQRATAAEQTAAGESWRADAAEQNVAEARQQANSAADLAAAQTARAAAAEQQAAQERARVAAARQRADREKARADEAEQSAAAAHQQAGSAADLAAAQTTRAAAAEQQAAQERARVAAARQQADREKARADAAEQQIAHERQRVAAAEQLAASQRQRADAAEQLAAAQDARAAAAEQQAAEQRARVTAEQRAARERLVQERQAWERTAAQERAAAQQQAAAQAPVLFRIEQRQLYMMGAIVAIFLLALMVALLVWRRGRRRMAAMAEPEPPRLLAAPARAEPPPVIDMPEHTQPPETGPEPKKEAAPPPQRVKVNGVRPATAEAAAAMKAGAAQDGAARSRALGGEGDGDAHPIVEALRKGNLPLFEMLFGELTGLKSPQLQRIAYGGRGEDLAIVCRAVGVDKLLFGSIFLLTDPLRGGDAEEGSERAKAVLRMYDRMPPATAQKVLAKWQRNWSGGARRPTSPGA